MRVQGLSSLDRTALEAALTKLRITQLELDPVRGNFDAAHLKEINRRIFRDLPAAGFSDVTPGVFRPAVPSGQYRRKDRSFKTFTDVLPVFYSRMDEASLARLDRALAGARPASWSLLPTAVFVRSMATLYGELDYVHAFSDGNSRTLRAFMSQLAREAGFDLDWRKIGKTDLDHDRLYVARDVAVNRLAMPEILHDGTLKAALAARTRLENNPTLEDLLTHAIRPARAIAFESLSRGAAIKRFPDLKSAYEPLDSIAQTVAAQFPNNRVALDRALSETRTSVLQVLNANGKIEALKRQVKVGSDKVAPAIRNNPAQRERPER